MKLKHVLFAATACGLVMAPAHRAAADNLGAFAVGAVALCIASGTCTGRNNSRSSSSGVSSATRQQNMDVQRSLNYFNYPVGGVDGALGRRSRAAISNYQADMGFPVSGYLDEFQRTFLVSSYQRAQAGAIAPYAQEFAAGGPRGFLVALRREQVTGVHGGVVTAGKPSDPFADPLAPAADPFANPNVVAAAEPPARAVEPTSPQPDAVTASTSNPAIPLFGGNAVPKSMTQHCTQVSTRTLGNGGLMTVSNISDPDLAIGEQFCLTRAEAIGASDALVSGLAGVTYEQVEAQCASLAGQLTGQLAGLTAKSVAQNTQDAAAYVGSSGLQPEQVVTTGKICLGVGYKTDNAAVALASAYLMVGVGQAPYGEAIGHHLRSGFGTPVNASASTAWIENAMGALDQGATPAFAPADSANRAALLRAALNPSASAASIAIPQPVPAAATNALPTFSAQ